MNAALMNAASSLSKGRRSRILMHIFVFLINMKYISGRFICTYIDQTIQIKFLKHLHNAAQLETIFAGVLCLRFSVML
ncbi:hypothetical protein BYT27DRAFT_6737099 [Phlegmacium glaucopus]|nr:hypothetical protein BYT27DRAFT_6737099 [Phlegmacium glaucopus]